MKPKRPHPLYHFEKDFTLRPKAVVPRGFNWPLLLGLIIGAVIVFGILMFLYWVFLR